MDPVLDLAALAGVAIVALLALGFAIIAPTALHRSTGRRYRLLAVALAVLAVGLAWLAWGL